MAQLRRYPNVPPYLGSHNMNGNSERVDQREKAKIARVQISDMEIKKKPAGPLFPPPRKVSDSSDEITKTIKKSLGDYSNFVKIMNQDVRREKAPGHECVGVMPVPATPTENKTVSFPSATNKTKLKDKTINSTQVRPKVNTGIEKLDQKPKLEQKPKSISDLPRHLKLGEKLIEKKDMKVNKISLEKYKSNQASCSASTSSVNKQKMSDDKITNNKNHDVNDEDEKGVKKEETSEKSHPGSIKKEKLTPQRTKPMHIDIPTRNPSPSSLLQSPQHRDMKVQNILKEMTESVHMPLTGICTPLPKQDSLFRFPSSVNEKENSQVSSDTANSFMKDFDISDDEDSDDERENDGDNNQRLAGQTRSRSSSSSSSSSSGESSDSEGEEADDDKPSVVQKTSMLNSPPTPPSASGKIHSSPVHPVATPPKHNNNDSPDEIMNETSQIQTKSTSDKILDNSRTSGKSNESNIVEKSEEKSSNKGRLDQLEQTDESKFDNVKATSPSAGQRHPVSRTKTEIKESLPDTKIRIKIETGNNNESFKVKADSKVKSETGSSNGSFKVKTDSKVKSETGNNNESFKGKTDSKVKNEGGSNADSKIKCETGGSNESFKVKTDSKTKSESKKRSEPESKQVGEVKNNTEKTAEKSSEVNSKNSSKLGAKLKNGVIKIKKSCESKLEKKSDESVVQKKPKRKHSSGEAGKHTKETSSGHQSSKEKANLNVSKDKTTKEKSDELSSKDTNRTKSVLKEKKKKDRSESFGFDCPEGEEEDSVIDVVGDDSPVAKKKKSEQNGMSGVHKNGHVDMPLGIQLVHDKDKDPTSLIVKIPLSFLKRIPSKFAHNLSVESSHAEAELGSLETDGKRPKDLSQKKNKENGDTEQTEEIDKHQHVNNHGKRTPNGKRSPSWDSGEVPKKRVRRDSQREKSEAKKQKTIAELNAECEADIRKVEPDAHLLRAKTLKREADKLSDKEAKSRTYVEAIVRFICCGKALEDKEDGELRAGQMYSETTDLLRFILKHVLGKTEDKRLLILCLRVQSLLLYKLYRMKGKQAVRNTQILAEHFKATHKNNITSPYTSTTFNKHGSTPSPMSPTPSPAGSVGSTGSNSSGEGNHTQSGRHASTASVTSPVSVSIPQRIHSVMAQHVSSTSKLVNSIDMWEKADSLSSGYQDFFTTVNSICGALAFHSSIPHIVNYVKNSLSNLHEHGKRT